MQQLAIEIWAPGTVLDASGNAIRGVLAEIINYYPARGDLYITRAGAHGSECTYHDNTGATLADVLAERDAYLKYGFVAFHRFDVAGVKF